MRNAFAEIIVDLTESVEPNLVPEMIEMFKGLIKDVEGEVRIQAAKQIHTFCKALPADSRKNYTMQHIIPLLKDLAMGKRLTFESVNSQAPDVPELAHQGIFQLSRLSVNCYVKTIKKYPLHLNLTNFVKVLSVPHDYCGSHNNFIKFL